MGVNGILPRILPSAGRENYDLRSLRNGCIELSGRTKRRRLNNLQAPESLNEDETATREIHSQWRRRKLRIAIDLHGWISRACHGNGAYLMDERHLSYHGRAMLRRERHENAEGHAHDEAAAHQTATAESAATQQQNEYIQKVLQFIMHRIFYLQNECNIDVLLVLDGKTPPIKQTVVSQRREHKKRAVHERDLNDSPSKQSSSTDNTTNNTLQENTNITEQEALSRISASKRAGSGIDPILLTKLHTLLLQQLQSHHLPYLISPYEADGQLAYLSNGGYVDGVITEDSDLICLGVDRLIYKLGRCRSEEYGNPTRDNGLFGTLLTRSDLGSAQGIDLLDFSDSMLVIMFVCAGCDYCDSLQGIGIVTARDVVARAFFTENKEDEGRPVLERVLHALYNRCHREERARLLPLHDGEKEMARHAYEKAFLGSIVMYRHPLVFDPVLGDMIANDVSSNGESKKATSVSAQFMREEQVLMEYEPYRQLVMDKEALYRIVGRPRPFDLAKKMVRGLVDRHYDIDTTSSAAAAAEDGANNNEVDFQPPTKKNTDNQPSSQEFTVLETSTATQPSTKEFIIGRGTQQSKSSDKTTLSSSLSPDLLASPSPAKWQS
ncbi:hypothetical protein ACHAWO_007523 [Cyclotella atomus]|uniref:XPG-I domain-containing protein n=1 Tax=Cyclotella atomus TaxID=382360 RepID=A0ABD3MZK7_9STRA